MSRVFRRKITSFLQVYFGIQEARFPMTQCAVAARVVCFVVFCAMFAMSVHGQPRFKNWDTLKNQRHGFSIGYPNDVFEQKLPPTTDEGGIFFSKDGKAKLLVGAFANEGGNSLTDYREFLLTEHYAGAIIDYAPLRKRWFVLSGIRNDEMFYERVSFTCGGKLINSWAMLYPVAERKMYDRVVEAVARKYTPGEGQSGTCD